MSSATASGGGNIIVALPAGTPSEPDCWIHIVKFSQTSIATSVLATSGTNISVGFSIETILFGYGGQNVNSRDLTVCPENCKIFNGFKIDGFDGNANLPIEVTCDNTTEIILFQVKLGRGKTPENYYSINTVNFNHDNINNILFVSSSIIKKLDLDKIEDAWIPYVPSISSNALTISSSSSSSSTGNYYSNYLREKCPVIFYLFCNDNVPTSIPQEYLKHLLNLMIIDISKFAEEPGALENIITHASRNLTTEIKTKISNLFLTIQQQQQYNLPIAFVTAMDYPKLIEVSSEETRKKIEQHLFMQCEQLTTYEGKLPNKMMPSQLFVKMRQNYEETSSHPWGFVKLNLIPNGQDMEPNQRLSIRKCGENTLLVNTVFDPEPMYVLNQGTRLMEENAKYMSTQQQHQEIEFSNSKFKRKNFAPNSKQIFGPFKKIYPHGMSNKRIADDVEMQKILNIIKNPGGIALIIGYGASGAGKTSSLIYFNKGATEAERIGILMQLLNEMKDVANTITVYSTELCDNTQNGYQGCDDPEVVGNGVTFTWHQTPPTDWASWKPNEPFVPGYYTDHDEIDVKNPQRIQMLFDLGEIPALKLNNPIGSLPTKINIKWCSIGQYSQIIVDSNRNVAGTSNNQNSSRSHEIMTCVCNLNNNGGKSLLVVGDLAGAESKFACELPSIIQAFANLKNDNDKSGRDARYYYDRANPANVPEVRDDIADFTNDDKVCEMFSIDQELLNYAKVVFFYMVNSLLNNGNSSNFTGNSSQSTLLSLIPSGINSSITPASSVLLGIKQHWEKGKRSTSKTIIAAQTITESQSMNTTPANVEECIKMFKALIKQPNPIKDPVSTLTTDPNMIKQVEDLVYQYMVSNAHQVVSDPNAMVLISSLHNPIIIQIHTTNVHIGQISNYTQVYKITEDVSFKTDMLMSNIFVSRRPAEFYNEIQKLAGQKGYCRMDACFTTNSASTANPGFTVEQIDDVIAQKPNGKTFYICLFGTKTTSIGKIVEDWQDSQTKILGVIKIKKMLGQPNTNDGKVQTSYLIDYAPYSTTLQSTATFKKENLLYRTDIQQQMYSYLQSTALNTVKPQSFNIGTGTLSVTTRLLQSNEWSEWKKVDKNAINSVIDGIENKLTNGNLTGSNNYYCAITVSNDQLLGTIQVPGLMEIKFTSAAAAKPTMSVRYQLEEHLIQKFSGQNNQSAKTIIDILTSYKFYVGIRPLVIKECKFRGQEGERINDALINLPPGIKMVYAVKNAGKPILPLSVLSGTDMLNKPLDQILFNMEITDETIIQVIDKSNILKSIFSFVIDPKINIFNFVGNTSKGQQYKTICEHLDVILMCVINISKKTEKPTKQENLQYLSIDGLHRLYIEIDKDRGDIDAIKLTDRKKTVKKLIDAYYSKLDQYITDPNTKTCSVNQTVLDIKNLIGNPKYTIKDKDNISFTTDTRGCNDIPFEQDLQDDSTNSSSSAAGGGAAGGGAVKSSSTSKFATVTIDNIFNSIPQNQIDWSLLHILMRIRIVDTDSPEQKQKNVDLFISTLKLIIDAFDVFNSPTIIGTIKTMSNLINGISTDLSQDDPHYTNVIETNTKSKKILNLTNNEIPSQ